MWIALLLSVFVRYPTHPVFNLSFWKQWRALLCAPPHRQPSILPSFLCSSDWFPRINRDGGAQGLKNKSWFINWLISEIDEQKRFHLSRHTRVWWDTKGPAPTFPTPFQEAAFEMLIKCTNYISVLLAFLSGMRTVLRGCFSFADTLGRWDHTRTPRDLGFWFYSCTPDLFCVHKVLPDSNAKEPTTLGRARCFNLEATNTPRSLN